MLDELALDATLQVEAAQLGAGDGLPVVAMLDHAGSLRQRVAGHVDQGVLVRDHVELRRGEARGSLGGLLLLGDSLGGVRA